METDEIILDEPQSYQEEINIVRRKIYLKLIVSFIGFAVLILVGVFDRHIAFNGIFDQMIFTVLLWISFFIVVGIFIYLKINKFDDHIETLHAFKKIKEIFDLVFILPMFVLLYSLINSLFFSFATVKETSMEPNYYEGDDIVIEHIFNDYKRFDVIILEADEDTFYIKRIIGLPGETIKLQENSLYIDKDGQGIDFDFILVEQEFLKDDEGNMINYTYCDYQAQDTCTFNVPDGAYFVLGDHREVSVDSRNSSLGMIMKEDIYGVVVYKYNNFLRDIFN
ncbi:signal peptidase I [Candidatus Izimaplasma bacterium ZiA1]|uniref:signal peptidase I n=1 Tax=Candidatus Izimoplasma sp. ZiA1 TaxID=2024899 RepID=UPI000BAA4AC9|nr:signal peptidase I [Candidatus Izimaplasma bacterium ZiA1]